MNRRGGLGKIFECKLMLILAGITCTLQHLQLHQGLNWLYEILHICQLNQRPKHKIYRSGMLFEFVELFRFLDYKLIMDYLGNAWMCYEWVITTVLTFEAVKDHFSVVFIMFKESVKNILFTSVLWKIKSQREAFLRKNKCKAIHWLTATLIAFTISINYLFIWHHCSIISDFWDNLNSKKSLFKSEMTILVLRGLRAESHHYPVLDLARWTIEQCITSVLRAQSSLAEELCGMYQELCNPSKVKID